MIDLKNPKPFSMAKEYPIDTGLADFFKVLREQPNASKEQASITAIKGSSNHAKRRIQA